jgi:hypothetical protein
LRRRGDPLINKERVLHEPEDEETQEGLSTESEDQSRPEIFHRTSEYTKDDSSSIVSREDGEHVGARVECSHTMQEGDWDSFLEDLFGTNEYIERIGVDRDDRQVEKDPRLVV